MSSIYQQFAQFNEVVNDRVVTTDATLTDVASIEIPINKYIVVSCEYAAAIDDYSEALGGTILGTFRRGASGNIIQIGSIEKILKRSAALILCDVELTLDNVNFLIKIQVKGKAATTINWSMKINYIINN